MFKFTHRRFLIMKSSLILMLLFDFTFSSGQIFFYNPGLEGLPTVSSPPPFWITCSWTPDTEPVNQDISPWYLFSSEGTTYLGLQTDSSSFFPEYHEACSQEMRCSLIPNHLSSFHLTLYSVINYIEMNYKTGAVLKLYGGLNQCDFDTLLWQSPVLDSVWHQYTSIFTPNKAYNYLIFQANNINIYDGLGNKHSYIGIDALSEITVQGYNFFSFPNTDTTINKGACVSFTAASDDTAATFYWSTTAGDSVATGDSINVCPATTTTYICTATLGCGQQFKDSVTVTVLGGGSSGTPIIKIPNLLSADNPTWQIINLQSSTSVTIYNTLGQLVYKRKEYNNTLNINTLSAATYFYEVKYGSQTYRGKLMVVR